MMKTFMTRDIDKKEDKGFGLNLNYFLNCDDKIQTPSLESSKADALDLSPDTEKKKRGRPKKEEGVATYLSPENNDENLPLYQSNQPYLNSYLLVKNHFELLLLLYKD